MVQKEFYLRFKTFDFILIYQLDSYVFRNELDFWCEQNYDYIGAPWFEGFSEKSNVFSGVGNGGFSLRKVSSFLKVFKFKGPFLPISDIWSRYRNKSLYHRSRYGIPAVIKSLYQNKNRVKYFIKQVENNLINEDYFWSEIMKRSRIKFNIPPPDIALKFAFEKNPSLLFKKNGNRLPFGCHGWHKYEWETFYKSHISLNEI
jgi:hypothetical protein